MKLGKFFSIYFVILLILLCFLMGCERENVPTDESFFSPTASPQPTAVAAEYVEGEEYFEDGYYFEVICDAVKIVGHQDNGDTEITVPEELAGKQVKILGSDAFYQHKNVKSIILPETLTAIEGAPFYRCYSLEKIIIPRNVCQITGNPFFRCTSLAEISVDPENIYYSSVDGVMYNRAKTKLIAYPEGKQDEDYTIPDTVTTIEDDSFGYHTRFKTLTISKSVISFPNYNMFVFPDDYTLIVQQNSVAEWYAKEYVLKYEVVS